jgi:SPP1 family predicted phage head-tail adaptor
MIRAGELNRRITIQQGTVTKDTSGAPQTTWTTHVTVWAGREHLPGRELWQAMQVREHVPVRYKIRYLATVTARMRLVDGSRTFDITSVSPDARNTEMILLCEEVV